jgi:hypothetical protein
MEKKRGLTQLLSGHNNHLGQTLLLTQRPIMHWKELERLDHKRIEASASLEPVWIINGTETA